MGNKRKDLTGQIFDKLTVLERIGQRGHNTIWKCRCECGKEVERYQFSFKPNKIKRAKTHSCGCATHIKGKNSKNWKGFGDIPASLISAYKFHARERKIEWRVSLEDLWNQFEKQHKKCCLTGELLTFGRHRKDITASLDRIDSNLHYTIENIQWVHKRINMMKQNYTIEEFISWCEKVVNHIKNR